MYTQKVIHWIVSQEYSKQHWITVAQEIREKEEDISLIIEQLAEAIKAFHYTYKHAVIKPDNLLDELVESCYQQVNWKEVAEHILEL